MGELLVLGGELLFHHHDLGITVLDGHEILVLHVHVLAELGIGSGGQKAVDNVLHLGIAGVTVLFDVHHLVVVAVFAALVEDAQHLLQTVVHTAPKTGYLDDDAVVDKALDKRVGKSPEHLAPVVVVRLVAHVKDRLLDVAHLVTQQVDRYHGDAVAVRSAVVLVADVLGVGILRAEVLAETKGLGFQPRLLKLYQHQAQLTVGLADLRAEVDAEHRYLVTCAVGILVLAYLGLHHFFLQQGGKQGLHDAVVLQQVLENSVVDGVGDM